MSELFGGAAITPAFTINKDIRRGSFCELAVAKQDRFRGVDLRRELAQQDIADEGDRLDVAAQPPVVGSTHCRGAVFHQLARRIDERRRHHEYRGLDVLREGVIALRHAARHLEIHALVLEALPGDELTDEVPPLATAVRVADLHRGEAALEARKMFFQAEGHARIHRHHLVHAVAEDEPAVEHRHFRVLEREELPVQENRRRCRYLSHSRSVSHARPKIPAVATGSRVTSA
jgi:hypothetical protein